MPPYTLSVSNGRLYGFTEELKRDAPVSLYVCIMFERYCFTRSKSSIMSSSLLFTMLMLASMSLMLAFGRCTLKMNWKQKAPQTPPRMGPTQNTQ